MIKEAIIQILLLSAAVMCVEINLYIMSSLKNWWSLLIGVLFLRVALIPAGAFLKRIGVLKH